MLDQQDAAAAAPPPAAPDTLPVERRPEPPPVPPDLRSRHALEAAPSPADIAPTPSPRRRETSSPLEFLIGGKLAAWIGAIVIVIGIALLVHLTIKSGWWGALSPTHRCLLVAAFGLTLVACGEIALRCISRAASVGLFGAGLGVLYTDAFASFRFFEIVSSERAFLLMALVAAFGFACTLRTKFRTIGVLSLVGGYLAPILIGGRGHDLELLSYLTALFCVALALSAANAQQYRVLRYLALGGQTLLGGLWLAGASTSHWLMAIIFVSVWWLLLLAEAILAAKRDQSQIGNPISVLLASTAYATAGCWILDYLAVVQRGDLWLGAFTLGVAVLSAAAAMLFGSGLGALRAASRNAMDRLTVALFAQCGALLVVASAMQFEDFGQTVGWLAIAVAAVETGRRLPSRGVAGFGLMVWVVALVAVAIVGATVTSGITHFGLSEVLFENDQLRITKWSLLGLLAIAASLAIAHRVRSEGPRSWPFAPAYVTFVAAVTWLAVGAISASGLLVTGVWLGGALALLAAHRLGRRQSYVKIALMMLTVAGIRLLKTDALKERLGSAWDAFATTPFLNWQFGAGLALACGLVWAVRLLPEAPAERHSTPSLLRIWVPVEASFVLLLSLSFELDHLVGRLGPEALELLAFPPPLLRALLLTGLFAIGGAAMVLTGSRRQARMMAGCGWAFIYAASATWLTYDTLVWRLAKGITEAPLVINLQFAIGALLVALMLLLLQSAREHAPGESREYGMPEDIRILTLALVGLLGLWLGSLEIDRLLTNMPTAAQAGLSVYWAVYGVALVVLGFMRRAAVPRYAGLALLALTVGKVLLVDLATVERIWRVASVLISGLLLVATSVLYSKLSPRLLNRNEKETATP